MSLLRYQRLPDFFAAQTTDPPSIPFPCCCCEHLGGLDDRRYPCDLCGHEPAKAAGKEATE